jgi:hypothetical protein
MLRLRSLLIPFRGTFLPRTTLPAGVRNEAYRHYKLVGEPVQTVPGTHTYYITLSTDENLLDIAHSLHPQAAFLPSELPH